MGNREEIEEEITRVMGEMNCEDLHPSIQKTPGIETPFSSNLAVSTTRISDKYTDGANLELLTAHSCIRYDRARLLHDISSQGFFETHQSLEIGDLKSLDQIINKEIESSQIQSGNIQTKSNEQLKDFNSIESHLISKIRDKLDSKFH